MRRLKFLLAVPASLLVATPLPGLGAEPSELSPGKQVIFLGRVIAYDGRLKERVGDAVNIGVLAKKGDRDSERMADRMVKAFALLETSTVLGLPVRIQRVDFNGRDELARTIGAGGIDTLYVCAGLDANLKDIKAVARYRKVLTVASQEAQLRQGLSLGVFLIEGKNTIEVNLEASREEGVAFGPELLRLATVVR